MFFGATQLTWGLGQQIHNCFINKLTQACRKVRGSACSISCRDALEIKFSSTKYCSPFIRGKKCQPRHTHTYVYGTLGGWLGGEGALVSMVIYQDMWSKLPWQAKRDGEFLLFWLWTLTVHNSTLLCTRRVRPSSHCVWICIIQPQRALQQEKRQHSRTKKNEMGLKLEPNMPWGLEQIMNYRFVVMAESSWARLFPSECSQNILWKDFVHYWCLLQIWGSRKYNFGFKIKVMQ